MFGFSVFKSKSLRDSAGLKKVGTEGSECSKNTPTNLRVVGVLNNDASKAWPSPSARSKGHNSAALPSPVKHCISATGLKADTTG